MKKMKHKILPFLLLFPLTLAACSNDNSGNGTFQESIQSDETTAENLQQIDMGGLSGDDNNSQGDRYLNITLDGSQTVIAALVESPAAEEFVSLLPMTFTMNEHLNRQKEVYLDFSLSEENLQNTVYQYEIGDIVYWHPGPTMGIFYDHDGRDISAGIEVLARLDQEGINAFAQAADSVEVTIALADANDIEMSADLSQGRQLNIILDSTDVLTATIIESPATEEFLTHLPLTIPMTDYVNREKHGPLSFSISDENLLNITQDYEIGDVTYYPPGPTFSVFYDHDGNIIAAGLEVIARIDTGLEIFSQYPGGVEITVELAEQQ